MILVMAGVSLELRGRVRAFPASACANIRCVLINFGAQKHGNEILFFSLDQDNEQVHDMLPVYDKLWHTVVTLGGNCIHVRDRSFPLSLVLAPRVSSTDAACSYSTS